MNFGVRYEEDYLVVLMYFWTFVWEKRPFGEAHVVFRSKPFFFVIFSIFFESYKDVMDFT